MAELPREPKKGAPVTADWARDVSRALREQRIQAGPGLVMTRTPEGTTLSLTRRHQNARGEKTILCDSDTNDPETGETIPDYAANLRLVVDWKYDADDHKIKVLYGTLTLFGNALAVVPDVDEDGNLLWSDGSIESPGGPFGGNGTEAVEESY